jgi:spore coat protein U-like protein
MKLVIQSQVMRFAALMMLTFPLLSSAGVATAAFTISARYQQTCEISAVPVLDFGTITSNASPVTTSDTLVVSCSVGSATPFGVWAPLSANASGTQRRMKNNNASAGNYLNYSVFMGATGSTVLPTTSTTTGYTSPTGTGTTGYSIATKVGIQLRATLPAGQTLTQGYYVDDLVLTVSY